MDTTSQNTNFDQKYDHFDFPTIAPTKENGHPGHTTPKQDEAVHQLRVLLEAKGYSERLDTLTLVRRVLPQLVISFITDRCSFGF